MNFAIRLDGVTKRYGSFVAVDALDLAVPAGQIVGFLGPNGAGKTTTIRMIMSILYPDSGRLEVLGHPRSFDVKDRIGYLPEERGLYRKMSVEASLRFFGRLKGLSGDRLRERIDTGLRSVGLDDWRRKPVEALSKGMQQKLQFVTTVLHEPELVILDEPFSGLDPINSELLKKLMLDLKRRGCTVIFSTHQMESAEKVCDRFVLINRGRKLIDGTLAEIQARFVAPIVNIVGAGDFERLVHAPGVVRSELREGGGRFVLGDGADPQELLRLAAGALRVTRFELETPDLHEIFVRLVGADAPDAGAAAPQT